MHKLLSASIGAVLALSGTQVFAQANVKENQETYLYVDANTGSDGNSGSQQSPFKTIQMAVYAANDLNQGGTGVRVIVNPGFYRESVNIQFNQSTAAPLTVQAAAPGTAVITGADVVYGWKQQNATTYMTYWPHDVGSCAIPSGWPTSFAPIAQRAEVVTVDGVPLTQVMAFNDLQPGTFYYSDRYNLLHIAPPTGTDMSTAVVEAAVRPTTLTVQGRQNVVLRGLTFQQAANCFNATSASVTSSYNVLVDSITANWNNWGGFGVYASSSVTVQNSTASYNGGVGFLGTRDQNVAFNGNESDFNNWRGAQGAFYDWAAGGTKFFEMRNTSVQNHLSYNNQAQGLWFDTDNQNIDIDSATLSGNVLAALQVERNEGPLNLQNSYLCNSGTGLNLLTSWQTTVKNNTFYNNGGTNTHQAQVFLGGRAGGIFIGDFLTGAFYDLFTTGTVLTGNRMEDAQAGQNVIGTYLDSADWWLFTSSLQSDHNHWYDPQTGYAFNISGGQHTNLPGWQSNYGADLNSSWDKANPSAVSKCAAPSPTYTDFQAILNTNVIYMTAGQGTATVNVRSFGFGPVTLWLEGLPSDVSANFSQNNLVNGMVTVSFQATSSSATTQTVPVILWAVSGSRVHTVTFYVSITPQ